MGTSLNGLTPAGTYPGLIKTGDNAPIDGTLKTLSDGNGNNLPMAVSTTAVNFTNQLQQGGVAVPTASQVNAKQDTLVSGTNIKTINGTSVLGSGNIVTPSTPPSGVAGAIQFSNGSAFASDSANLFWDDTNNRLGVGTNSPTSPLTVIGASQFGNASGSGNIETFDGFYSYSFGKSTSIYNPNNNYTRIFMQSSQTFYDNTSGNFQFRSAGATVMNMQSGNFAVGNGSDSILARTHIKGSGSTSATTSLLVQNSAGTQLMKIPDGGARIQFGLDIEAGTLFGQVYIPGKLFLGSSGSAVFGNDSLDASAVLQANSTTKGFLPPRMTTTQKNAIATPAAGLVVYDSTTNKLCCYNGSTWNDLF